MVVVRQKVKISVCKDPSDVNKNILGRNWPLTTIEQISVDKKVSNFFDLLVCTKVSWQIMLSEKHDKY